MYAARCLVLATGRWPRPRQSLPTTSIQGVRGIVKPALGGRAVSRWDWDGDGQVLSPGVKTISRGGWSSCRVVHRLVGHVVARSKCMSLPRAGSYRSRLGLFVRMGLFQLCHVSCRPSPGARLGRVGC